MYFNPRIGFKALMSKLGELKIFVLLFFLAALLGLIIHLGMPTKGHFVYLLQDVHHPTLDMIMHFITDFGSFPIVMLCILWVLISDRSMGLFALTSGILEWLLVDTLKKGVFRLPRPSAVLLEPNALIFPEGMRVLCCNSFPSGHSALAFLTVTLMLFSFSNKFYQTLFFFLAFLIAFSRVYLGQHFIEDTIAGSILGFLCPCIVYLVWKSFVKEKSISNA